MKKQTAKHGGSISIPRRGGFSLSVGKYVVKGVRCKKECLDLCCKYTCLRHIWQYAGGIIHRSLGCNQLRWQRQRAAAIFFLYFLAVFGGFLSILIPFLTSCDPHLPCVPHLSVAFYVVKGKASPEQFRRGFAVFSAACFSTR